MSSSHEEWSDEDVEAFLKRLLTAVLVVGIGCYIFSPHRRRNDRYPTQNLPNGAPVRTPLPAATLTASTMAPPNSRARTPQEPSQDHPDDEEGIESFLKPYIRVPPHHIPLNQITGPGGRCISSNTARASYNGLVPFRCTRAALLESSNKSCSKDDDGHNSSVTIFENRKDRARILARLFAARKIDPPPGKGKILILSLSFSRIKCCDNLLLHRVLYLLGTYYNTFIMVQYDGDQDRDKNNQTHINEEYTGQDNSGIDGIKNATEQDLYRQDKDRWNAIISKLYFSGILTHDAISPHRVVITKSVLSRIAFVRSFPVQPDYVIIESEEGDWDGKHQKKYSDDCSNDEDLQLQLTKFGYSVLRIKSLDALLQSD
jgi:hypothetical protein